MCLYPKLIRNKKYTSNKKNGGIIPPISDNRTLWVPVGCGNCIECRKKYSREWQVRLSEEIKLQNYKWFVTLTFDEDSLNKLTCECTETWMNIVENDVATLAVRRFLERWRKAHGKSVKHWLVTELGHENTERIHLHGIIWCDDVTDIALYWKYGIVHIGKYVNLKTVNYIVKYISKVDNNHKGYKSKILCSKGIGRNYLNKLDSKRNKYNGNNNTKEYYTTPQGRKINLPNYYRNKIYSEDEREKLWIEKLDNDTTWIMGEKVSTENENELMKLLQYYQKINIRLGYGDNTEEWSVREYKRQRANLKKKIHGNTPKTGPL